MAVVQPIPAPTVVRPTDKTRAAAPAPVVAAAAAMPRFRRCTFRRVDATPVGRSLTMYEVQCTFPDRVNTLPLGDLAAAHPVCAACTNPGIFRADSD